MKTSYRFMVGFFGVVLMCCSFGACAGSKPLLSVEDQATIVANRAGEYWNYKVKGDLEAAYQYEHPDFRKAVKLADYLMSIGGGVKWLEAKAGSAVIDGKAAKVEVKIRYAIVLGPYFPKEGKERNILTHWRLVDGTWYHVPGGRKERSK
jgi:hypothetical protein